MRTLLFSAALVLAAAGCKDKAASDMAPAAEATEAPEEKLPEISIAEVEAGIAARSLTLVDCNGEGTRKKVGVIEGAILVDDEEMYSASVLPADKATRLVFYCGGHG